MNFPDETFELFSIPAHDRGGSEVLRGSEIGSAKQLVQPRDVMVSKIVPHIPRARVVSPLNGKRQIASGEWIVFRSLVHHPEFLKHYLLSPDFRNRFLATVAGVGGSLLRARPAAVAEIDVPVPPIEEQGRIAAILDATCDLQTKALRAQASLGDLDEALMKEFIGSASSTPWPTVPIESIAAPGASSIRTGPFGSQLLHSEFVDSGVAVLGIDNAVHNEFRWASRRYITRDKYASLQRYTVHPGDVVVTIMGTCGRCAVIPEDIPLAINTKHLCCITVDRSKCLPEFLHASFLWQPLTRKSLRQATKGAIMEGLNMSIIKRLPLILPPLSDQSRFVAMLDAVAQQRARVQRQKSELDRTHQSVLARAFSGSL